MKLRTNFVTAIFVCLLALTLESCGKTSTINMDSKNITKQKFDSMIQGTPTKKLAYVIQEGKDEFFKISSLDQKETHKIGDGSLFVSFAWAPTGDQVAVALMGGQNSGLQRYSLTTKSLERNPDFGELYFNSYGNMDWDQLQGLLFSGSENKSEYEGLYGYYPNFNTVGNFFIYPKEQNRTGPSFSPNGAKVAYYSSSDPNQNGSTSKINCFSYFDSIKGRVGEQIDITCGSEYVPFPWLSPSWENSSQKFITFGYKNKKPRILLFNTADNSYKDLGAGDYPDWSPYGNKFVFSRDNQLFIQEIDGEIKSLGLRGSAPKWSPDGKFIAFAAGSTNGWAIYITDQRGSFRYQLDTFSGILYSIFWQP